MAQATRADRLAIFDRFRRRAPITVADGDATARAPSAETRLSVGMRTAAQGQKHSVCADSAGGLGACGPAPPTSLVPASLVLSEQSAVLCDCTRRLRKSVGGCCYGGGRSRGGAPALSLLCSFRHNLMNCLRALLLSLLPGRIPH